MKKIINYGLTTLLALTLSGNLFSQTDKELKERSKELIQLNLENDSNITNHLELGNIYLKLDKTNKAITEFNYVLNLDSTNINATYNRAKAFVYGENNDMMKQAEKDLTKVIASKTFSDKELAKVYLVRAEARNNLSEKPQDEYAAKRSYDLIMASKLDSLNPQIQYKLGLFYDDNEYYDASLESFIKAADLEKRLAIKENREVDNKYTKEFNRTKSNYELFGRVKDAERFKIVEK